MALTTYATLKSAVASWLMRDDTEVTARVPDFITMCESRTNMQLRTREMETTATLTISGSVFALPTDFIEARRVTSNTDPLSVLKSISLPWARQRYNTSGYPAYYVIQGSSLLVFPPNTSSITLDYYAKIPPLAGEADTNWLLAKAPQVYLYGSLMEAAPFLEDDNRIVTWANLYRAAIEDLLKADQRAMLGNSSARIRGTTP